MTKRRVRSLIAMLAVLVLVFGVSVPAYACDEDREEGSATSLQLVKTADRSEYDAVDEVVTYTYTLTNNGDETLYGPFTVSDDNVDGAVEVTQPSGGHLDSGDSVTGTATHTVTQADLDAGSVTNVATASARALVSYDDHDDEHHHDHHHTEHHHHHDSEYESVTSNTETVTVDAVQSPVLTLAKSADTTTYAVVGDEIDYSYLITNDGNVTLSGPFSVTDDLVTVTVPTTASLAPGESVTGTATYVVDQSDIDYGSVTNWASAEVTYNQALVTSNSDYATVYAADSVHPEITIEKYVSVDGGVTWYEADTAPGPDLSEGTDPIFKFVVTNTGEVTLYNVSVVDDIVGAVGSASPLAPGNSATFWYYDAEWTVGQHANTATASAYCEDAGSFSVLEVEQPEPCVSDSDMAHYYGVEDEDEEPPVGPTATGTLTITVVKSDAGSVAGLTVTVTGDLNASLTTNGSGVVTISGLAAGTYTANSGDTGYTSDGPKSATLATDSSAGTITITLTPEATTQGPTLGAIEGIVVDGDAALLAGATVTIYQGTTVYATTTSDADGAFSVANVLPGEYTAMGVLADYSDGFDGPVTVVAGETATMTIVLGQVVEVPEEEPEAPELPKTGATYAPNMMLGLSMLLTGLGLRRRGRH